MIEKLELAIKRFEFGDKYTIGHLFKDGVDSGLFTLEDKDREIFGSPVHLWKVPGETAIPRGRYRIVLRYSTRFKREMPYLENVNGFTGVMLHWGNDCLDTEGCPLVGEYWDGRSGFIGHSRDAFDTVFSWIKSAKEAFIEVS